MFNQTYKNNLNRWTVPYETFFVETTFGSTPVIAAGEKILPPAILLHRAGMDSTIWYKNIKAHTEKNPCGETQNNLIANLVDNEGKGSYLQRKTCCKACERMQPRY